MKPTVYLETTIPSYYADDRPAFARDIARTRTWWNDERGAYECFVSPVVIEELEQGAYPTKRACLAMIESLPVLALNDEIAEIAEVYQVRRLMPKFPVRDALHVALASYYRMEYLLTWNCAHIANANKRKHLEKVNAALDLPVPLIVTPYMLLPWEDSA